MFSKLQFTKTLPLAKGGGIGRLKNFFHLQALPLSIFPLTFESLFDFKRIFHRLEKSLSFNYTKQYPSGVFVIDVAKKVFPSIMGY